MRVRDCVTETCVSRLCVKHGVCACVWKMVWDKVVRVYV